MEEFRDVPGYEGYYQVSDLGRVKSLSRVVKGRWGFNNIKEYMLTNSINKKGYYRVGFSKDGIIKSHKVHILVAIAFLGHISNDLVVDHIDNDKSNNRLDNLQLITQRENSSKDQKNRTSERIGVGWHKKNKKWISKITINKKSIYLGSFKNEIDASNAYQNKLKEILSENIKL